MVTTETVNSFRHNSYIAIKLLALLINIQDVQGPNLCREVRLVVVILPSWECTLK
jgi:hypothetical protein